MNLSFFQRALILPVSAFMYFLSVLDFVTSRKAIKFAKRSVKIICVFLALALLSFVIFSYKTNTGSKILESYFGLNVQQNFSALSYKKEFPVLAKSSPAPFITSKAYLVADKKTGKVLFGFNAGQKMPPASTAKLMTALIALDIYNLDDVVSVPEICTTVDSTKAWLPAEQKFTVRELIYSMLIGSAGDSACVLSIGKLPYENFVSLMNRKSALLGLTNTHFSNPIGLDDSEGQNYSTPQDLLVLSETVMKNSLIADAVKTTKFDLRSVDKKFEVSVYSTNQLLYEIPNTLGIKTGTTESAGEVFIYDYADEQKDLIIVVMGSQDRFSDTKKLLSWTMNSYSWK